MCGWNDEVKAPVRRNGAAWKEVLEADTEERKHVRKLTEKKRKV